MRIPPPRQSRAWVLSFASLGLLLPPTAPPAHAAESQLLRMASAHFGGRLTAAERRLFAAIEVGDTARYVICASARRGRADDDQYVRANRIAWVCTDPKAAARIPHHFGIRIEQARIRGRLRLSDVDLDYPLMMEHCLFSDGIDLERAHVRWLSLAGSDLGVPGDKAIPLDASGIKIDGDLSLCDSFIARGAVKLISAIVGGDASFSRGQFLYPDHGALVADGLVLKGSLDMDSATVDGSVGLHDAQIDGNAVFSRGHFADTSGDAIGADRSIVKQSVFFTDNVHIQGWASFSAASIRATFHWHGVDRPNGCKLDLQSASVGTLRDESASWPDTLYLDGFAYDRIFKDSPHDSRQRLTWLRREGRVFLPQPYQQLAKVLREMGHEGPSRAVLIAMNGDAAQFGSLGLLSWTANRLLWLTIGHGYRPWQALFWLAGFFLLGWWCFALEAKAQMLVPVSPGEARRRNLPIYALDTLLPIVDLDQADHWRPTRPWVRAYWWLHTLAGWFLSTLFVIGVGGLVRS